MKTVGGITFDEDKIKRYFDLNPHLIKEFKEFFNREGVGKSVEEGAWGSIISGLLQTTSVAKREIGMFFLYCDIDIFEKLTIIIDQLFGIPYPDSGYIHELIIPNSVYLILHSAFENQSDITRIIIPTSIKSIKRYAFNGIKEALIIYRGTMEKWNKIDIDPKAFEPNTKIHCTNGDIYTP